MENPPFEDVFPIEHGNFPMVMLVFRGEITQMLNVWPIYLHLGSFEGKCR